MKRSAAVIFGVAILALAGCSVPERGDLAYGIDDGGDVVAFVQMCKDAVDAVIVYNSHEDFSMRWSFPEPVTDFGTLALENLDFDLQSGDPYSAYAGSSDNTASVRGAQFRVSDLDGLSSGEVLAGDSSNGYEPTVMTVGDFREMVRRDCAKRAG